MDKKYCSQCGKVNAVEGKFCAYCGARLVEINNEEEAPTNHRDIPNPEYNDGKSIYQENMYNENRYNDAMRSNLSPEPEGFWKTFKKKYFSFKDRLNRKVYFIRSFIMTVVAIVLFGIVEIDNDIITGIATVLAVAIYISSASLTVRRLHDLNLSGWWFLLIFAINFLPFIGLLINLAVALALLFTKGTSGPNNYGEDPLNQVAR